MQKTLTSLLNRPAGERPAAFLGFDGFLDTVGQLSHGDGRQFASMTGLGRFLMERQESNCALEIVQRARRMGGNMPLCANALATLGVQCGCVGAMGEGTPEPAFAAMHPRCSLYPVAMPGECLAIEFGDSKLFLADMSGPRQMTWEGILAQVGLERMIALANGADLLGLFNWGEIPEMQSVWQGFARDVLPRLSPRRRWVFFDLSDCSGRGEQAIRSVLETLQSFGRYGRVVLSVNDNELMALARALGFAGGCVESAGAAVYDHGAVEVLVHHSLRYARVFYASTVQTVDGIHIDNPVLVTGGGDHFNAGLCLGLLAGLPIGECALLGNTVSRLYVSTGRSPDMAEVLDELAAGSRLDDEDKEELL